MKNTSTVEYQDRMKRELLRKQQEIRSREYAQLERQTVTKHTQIPNMRDACAKVQAKNYQPTQQEIEYRRFTNGGFEDNAKGH